MALPLNQETDPVEDLEIELLLTAIYRHHGYDFRNYAHSSLRRRVQHMVGMEGLTTVSELQSRVLHDPACMKRFVNAMSVHTTSMFRDPEFFRALRNQVIPALRTYPSVRIWHAGCASGEEVYSMAILLEEAGVYDRCRLYATDLSDDLLAEADRGSFPLAGMRENTANYVRSGGARDFSSYYATERHRAHFRSSLRRNMVYSQHNLVSDAAFNEFHLVLCRNVLIYFDDVLRARVFNLLRDSMVRRAFLGLGLRETLDFSPLRDAFEDVNSNQRVYRRRA